MRRGRGDVEILVRWNGSGWVRMARQEGKGWRFFWVLLTFSSLLFVCSFPKFCAQGFIFQVFFTVRNLSSDFCSNGALYGGFL